MSADTCYHLITFDRTTGYPWSVNGKSAATSGYMGRSVPKDTLHVIATGFCRGQYRSIEALIYRPHFPYALASTGRIYSAGHMFVEGARSSDEVKNSRLGRPGHVLSTWRKSGGAAPNPANPDDYSVFIGDASGSETFISGFILSAGEVLVKPRATVKEGIIRNTDGVEIPNIPATNFRNEGGEGVIRIVSDSYAGPR